MISCHRVGAEEPHLVDVVRELFLEYEEFLGAGHVCVAGFEREVESLPGEYGAPSGALLLAREDDEMPGGCLALRTITTIDGRTTGELKRMWVRNAFRRCGAGQLLVENALNVARGMGLRTVHLDTVPSVMPEAVKLYERNGFVECRRYNSNLAEYAQFFWRML